MHPEFQFNSQYTVIDGQRLHYIDEGEGSVVVMVHGNPTWSFYYRNVIHQLRSKKRVIAFDHIGCGLSAKPQNYSYCLERHIANMSELLCRLKISDFSLIVHDWGGAIGFGYAIEHVKNIEKIAILNTAAFRSNRLPFRIRVCGWPVIGELIVRGLNGFAWPATFMAVQKSLDEPIKQGYLQPYDTWNNRIAIHRFVKDIPLNSRHSSYNKLKEIEFGLNAVREENVPILILWGEKDFCFTRHFYDRWKEIFPSAESFLFENGGHYILEDENDTILPILEKFFD